VSDPVVRVAREGRIARVVLDRPPLNVIDLATAGELAAAFESVAAHADLCAVLIEARGRAFSAGVDVRDHLPDRGAAMLHEFHRACLALAAVEAPTIAVVHAAALGGGCELTLMCDLVLAGDSATFGQPEIKLGVFPPLAAVALPRIVPPHIAAELVLTGRGLTAHEAERVGLVNRVVHDNALAAAAEKLAHTLAALSPSSLRLTKQALAMSRRRPTAVEIEESERFYVESLMNTPDAIEGLEAFMAKRAPVWGGDPGRAPGAR